MTSCVKGTGNGHTHVVSPVLYIKVYVVDKTWCEYEPNQTTDYAVNPQLITSKPPSTTNKGCFKDDDSFCSKWQP